MSDQGSERELGFEARMSDAEALMWNLEKDPWLNPNGIVPVGPDVDFYGAVSVGRSHRSRTI